MSDLNAGFAFSLHSLRHEELKSESIRELVVNLAMMDENEANDLEPVLDHLLRALMLTRDHELNAIEDDDEREATTAKLVYPDDPGSYFFDAYRQIAKKNDHAFSDEDLWWPDHWPNTSIWAANDLEYLATLTVGKDQNSRRALISYLEKHHPEMLNKADHQTS